MLEESYGEWDQADPSYNAGYSASGAQDGVYFDPKTGKHYGIIESRLYEGRSGFLGSKGSKYGSKQRDVYVLGEDELDSFRAMYKKYSGQKFRKDYKEAMSGFKRLAYQSKDKPKYGGNVGKTMSDWAEGSGLSFDEVFGDDPYNPKSFKASQYVADQEAEEDWLKTFMGQQASYRSETTQGERGQRRKAELQRQSAARENYGAMMKTGW